VKYDSFPKNGSLVLIALMGVASWFAMAVVALSADAAAGAKDPSVRELYDRVFPVGQPVNYERIKSVTPSEREELIAYLRASLDPDRADGRLSAWTEIYMALLGDDWARQAVVTDFWYRPRAYPRALLTLRDPKVIAMIGEGLFMEEEQEVRGDIILEPTQLHIAQVILKTLQFAPEFPEAVHAWANGIDENDPMAAMRSWYRRNKAALKAEKFGEVKPGTVGSQADARASEIYERMFSSKPIDYKRVESASAEERQVVVEYLRKYVNRSLPGGSRADLIVIEMAMLGDDWARETVVSDFWYRPRAHPQALLMIRDPKVIGMIGEGLFMEEVDELYSDVGYPPTQMVIAEVVLDTLEKSPVFDEEMHAWARQTWHASRRFMLPIIREWYRANEKALKGWKFEEVKRGTDADHVTPIPWERLLPPGLPAGNAGMESVMKPVTAGQYSNAGGAATKPRSVQLWLIGLVVVPLVGWLAWKWRLVRKG
jgi:hypothetical protein